MRNVARKIFLGFAVVVVILLLFNTGANAITVSNVTNKTPMATTVWILWNVSTEANNTVEYSINSDLADASFSSWSNNTSTPEIKLWSLQPNTIYYYRVWSYNATNESDNVSSSIYNFTTQECVSYKLVNSTDMSQTGVDNIIQEAVDMMCYSGGAIKLSSGTFSINGVGRNDGYDAYHIFITHGNVSISGTSSTEISFLNLTSAPGIRISGELEMDEEWDYLYEHSLDPEFGDWISNISISNFKVYGEYLKYENYIISAHKVHNLIVSDLHLEHLGKGIMIQYSQYYANNTIKNCTLKTIRRRTIMIWRSPDTLIRNNTIINVDGWSAIELNAVCANSTIENNTIRGSYYEAIYVYSGSNNYMIRNNTIEGCTSPWSYGIKIFNSRRGQIKDNYINNTYHGLYFQYDVGGSKKQENDTVSNNIISYCTLSAIDINKNRDDDGTWTIKNNVLYACQDGISYSGVDIPNSTINIKNNIIVNNSGYGLNIKHDVDTNIEYNDVWGNALGNYNNTSAGTGDISEDPLFADPDNGDFHLKSEAGRWNGTDWVNDNETSPCIDAGDPNSTYSNETYPHGQRINIGAYGNTPEASKSPYHKIYLSVPMTIYSNGEYSYPEPPITYKDNQTVNITFNVTDTTNLTINSYTSSQISFTATNTTTDQKMNITIYNGTFIVVNGKKYEIKKDGVVQQTKTASDNKVVFTDIPVGSDYVITESGDNGYTVTLAQGYNMLAWTSTTPTNSSNLCNEVPNCTYVYKKNPDGSWTAKQCGYPGGEFTVSRGFGFLAYVTEACEWTRDE